MTIALVLAVCVLSWGLHLAESIGFINRIKVEGTDFGYYVDSHGQYWLWQTSNRALYRTWAIERMTPEQAEPRKARFPQKPPPWGLAQELDALALDREVYDGADMGWPFRALRSSYVLSFPPAGMQVHPRSGIYLGYTVKGWMVPGMIPGIGSWWQLALNCVMTAAFVIAAATGIRLVTSRVHARRLTQQRCPGCAYPLVQGSCAECGFTSK